jgi:hypothetical protein
LKNSALAAIATLLIAQTSCVRNSPEKNQSLNIYQPSTLRLQKDQKIQTIDGVYTPQNDETWHSDARFRKLEREVYFK